MDYILPDSKTMEKMAEEYAKLKKIRVYVSGAGDAGTLAEGGIMLPDTATPPPGDYKRQIDPGPVQPIREIAPEKGIQPPPENNAGSAPITQPEPKDESLLDKIRKRDNTRSLPEETAPDSGAAPIADGCKELLSPSNIRCMLMFIAYLRCIGKL